MTRLSAAILSMTHFWIFTWVSGWVGFQNLLVLGGGLWKTCVAVFRSYKNLRTTELEFFSNFFYKIFCVILFCATFACSDFCSVSLFDDLVLLCSTFIIDLLFYKILLHASNCEARLHDFLVVWYLCYNGKYQKGLVVVLTHFFYIQYSTIKFKIQK